MIISEFYGKFTDEQSCKTHLIETRNQTGIFCKKCNSTEHYWLQKKEQWQCKKCSFRTTLRSGTLFESSNLPLKKWFEALYLNSNSKKGLSACELQRQLGFKRYEPAWYMLQKIRKMMGRINEEDHRNGKINLTNSCLSTIGSKKSNRSKSPWYNSNEQRAIFMVDTLSKKELIKNTEIGRLRILALDRIDELSEIKTATPHDYRAQRILYPHKFDPNVILNNQAHVILPWVYKAIANIKRVINGIYHHVSQKFAQLYYDEFSFKYNYRHHKDRWSLVLNHSLNFRW